MSLMVCCISLNANRFVAFLFSCTLVILYFLHFIVFFIVYGAGINDVKTTTKFAMRNVIFVY